MAPLGMDFPSSRARHTGAARPARNVAALVLLVACCGPVRVPQSALGAMRAVNNAFALAVRASDDALAARYTEQSDDAIARGDRDHFARLREAHAHRIEMLASLRDLARFGERLLDMAAAGAHVTGEIRAWGQAMGQKLDALLVEMQAAGAAVPREAERAARALRALAEVLR